MLVIVPTRGRPHNVERLEQALLETETSVANVLYAIDPDDPARDRYMDLDLTRIWLMPSRMRLGPTLNHVALQYLGRYEVIGFMGDDHLPRTRHWDQRILEAMDPEQPLIVYGNDLLQGAALPTAAFLNVGVIQAMGYMVPPGLVHLYIDNAWKALGEALGTLTYLPEVVIEHLHPAARKADWDGGYAEANAAEMNSSDHGAFDQWAQTGLPQAVEKIKRAYG